MCKNGGILLPPLAFTPSTAAAVPLPRRGRSWGGEIESLQNVGGRAMRAPTTLRKAATVRCVCNARLHHCNGWMHLQQSVAPPFPVGARIARPFIPDVLTTTLREGARRVIGATAKPLYAIDGKAEGLDRRSPQTSLFEGGEPSADGGRSSNPLLLRRISFFFRHTHRTYEPYEAYEAYEEDFSERMWRISSKNRFNNPGCRVETLLVSKGVMGFLGDLRGRNRNLPLIP